MTTKSADYKRVLALLQSTTGRFYPTFEIAQAVGAQDNSVQRAINFNLKPCVIDKKIISRKMSNSQAKEYAWVGEPVKVKGDAVPILKDWLLLTDTEKLKRLDERAATYPDGHPEREKIMVQKKEMQKRC